MGDGYNQDVKRLADYIRKQRDAGYSITTLRNYLISSGYDPRLVNAAIDSAYKPIAQKRKISLKTIIIILAAIVIVVGLVLVIMSIAGKEKAPQVQEPKQITFPEIERPPEKIEEPKPSVPTTSKKEQKVEPETKIEPEVELTQKEMEIEKTEPSILDIESQIAEISEEAGNNLCKSLTERKANSCYKKLAVVHNESKYCEVITSSGLRDNCYIVFAFAGDFTICDKIVNKYQQLNCRSLGRARTYQSEELLAQMIANATSS
ncbi:hypothetical protein KY335_01255 [Candidatus Woesearchaeota archaeon]|nr:hypothetical protein [Candidatus Woesearchaeota archaeon]MBW3013852.1 hypothetical protein [Candidatus Woesearchaeota archaeon]